MSSLASVFAALAADPEALAALWKQIPVGVCLFDSDGHPLSCNDLFNQIVDGSPTDGQQASPLSPLLARALAGQTITDVDLEWATQGSGRCARASAVPVRDGARLAGAIVVLDANPEGPQRETLGIVGHDLRNPLAAIRMTAQLLAKPDDMTSERRITLAKRILTSSTRMDSIVKTLVDYARAKAGALVRLERETVDLGALAARVIEEQTANLTGRRVELHTVGEVTGQWDAGRMEQIIGHLVSNAIRHGEGPASLTLRGEIDRVALVMQSQGPAIPPELLPRIFDPFQIGARQPGTPRRNIGLGLFVVKELATAHGGSVAVQSGEGGTQFTVTVPKTVG